ncbi:peptidoglycan-binding protein [Streptomyces sp. TRM66268-LWL]|uniref:Peptidoglycan-binding protein n=2 Tax=Streptomyces polyasparticus TaxID=2767826 RepID=A0ABR7SSB8_9ACTN|nr:peptidoglycan-binding protein [Streptomyces polyasparticus]
MAVLTGTGLAVAGVAPAAVATGQQVIDGSGDPTNDWKEEGNLSRTSHAHSKATRLWQTILWADGAKYKGSDGKWHTYTKSEIDGHFGKRTESATKYWQKREGLAVDGIVGKQTFGYADDFLFAGSGGTVSYAGYEHDVNFKRWSGKYHVKVGGQWKKATY